jgi:hypothetical protein
MVIATTVAVIIALEAIAAVLSGGRTQGASVSWPGVLLVVHASWALRRGAIRARLNRKDDPHDAGEHRWVVTIINADVLTRTESPVWFRTYVGAELLLGVLMTLSAVAPALQRIQQG